MSRTSPGRHSRPRSPAASCCVGASRRRQRADGARTAHQDACAVTATTTARASHGTYTIERFIAEGQQALRRRHAHAASSSGKKVTKRQRAGQDAGVAGRPARSAAQLPPIPNACQVLNLVLGPINLNLLGLVGAHEPDQPAHRRRAGRREPARQPAVRDHQPAQPRRQTAARPARADPQRAARAADRRRPSGFEPRRGAGPAAAVPSPRPWSSSPASSPPGASTSATTSARSSSTSRARTAATRRSTASSTCTRTTVAYDPAELRQRSRDTAALLVAAGLDPERCILFRQGDVPEHTELTWLLSSVTSVGELNRMHQFRDKSGAAARARRPPGCSSTRC